MGWRTGDDVDIENIWRPRQIVFFSTEPPGEEPNTFGPDFGYNYRTVPSRWPLPWDGDAVGPFDIRVQFKSDGQVNRQFILGETDSWIRKPSAESRLAAFTAVSDGSDPDVIRARQNLDWESQEDVGFYDGLEFTNPIGDFPPFHVDYAAEYWIPGMLIPAES